MFGSGSSSPRHGLPKAGTRVADVALVRVTHQRRHCWVVRMQRAALMARGCFRRGAKLHRRLGQPAQRLVEQ
jgi:hypothetical protein